MTNNIRLIVSFYADNVDKRIVLNQANVINKYRAGSETLFFQMNSMKSHPDNIDFHMKVFDEYPGPGEPVMLLLDIDAIPLQEGVLEWIFTQAEAGKLVGIAQRSNHLDNGAHIFCGAPCVAMTRTTWRKLGKPSAAPTARGDVCEEWTWKAQENGVPVEFIYPTRFKQPPIRMAWETDKRPYWVLEEDKPEHHYGRGTYYTVPGFGGDAFYHQYQSFYPGSAEMFVETATKEVAFNAMGEIDLKALGFDDAGVRLPQPMENMKL